MKRLMKEVGDAGFYVGWFLFGVGVSTLFTGGKVTFTTSELMIFAAVSLFIGLWFWLVSEL